MRIAALVKQIPKFDAMELGADGRLVRAGLELEMNPYCRRAVSQAVALAAEHGGSVTVVTLGPPSAEDSLREAIAWGLDAEVAIDGVLVTDPSFAGSDTLATARALAATLIREGPFDLILLGRNSVDADTGQVPPELAELLDLPFLTGVRHLAIDPEGVVHARCELDDGWMQAETCMPAVLSTAERLIDPCKVEPDGRAVVPAERIKTLGAPDLGPGPWGEAGSPTRVGRVRLLETERLRHQLRGDGLDEQIARAIEILVARGALDPSRDDHDIGAVPAARPLTDGPLIQVLVEPEREQFARELLGTAARLAIEIDGHVEAIAPDDVDVEALSAWGADLACAYPAALPEEAVAPAVRDAWAVLAPSTTWGREVCARAAVRSGSGLVGDAVGLELGDDRRLVAWKPAFGGQLVAEVTARSETQMVTVRAGMLPLLAPRRPAPCEVRAGPPRIREPRVGILARTRDDDLDILADATAVVGVGMGVVPEQYPALQPLLDVLGAELAATRKVTDQGWLPRARQVGITGRSIAPRLYVALGLSGKFNHMVGVRAARTVLAVNPRPDAPVFDAADVGIVGDWQDVVPRLVAAIASATELARSS